MAVSSEIRPAPQEETLDGSFVRTGPASAKAAPLLVAGASEAEGGSPLAGALSGLPERYEDRCLLGRGAFGEVRRVYDRKLERVVAMKLLRPEVRDSPRLHARFLSEIKLTAKLHHPGIIAIFDFGEMAGGHLWFTMPEVRGRTLKAVITEAFAGQERGAMPATDALVMRRRLLDLFARVCDAMAYAHSRGVIHRDLKPNNIMVGEFGRVTVMDWGLARRVGRSDEGDEEMSEDALPAFEDRDGIDPITRTGEVLGTPAYMAPEQAHGEVRGHGPAADVFALGGILFHVLTGNRPRGAAERARSEGIGAARSIGAVAPNVDDLRRIDAGVPAELASICARAMALAPSERYVDAGELAGEIEAFSSGARRRERALEKLHEALATGPAIADLRARAKTLSANAGALLSGLRPFDPVALKRRGWEMQDAAERLDQEATIGEVVWIEGVHGALAIDPDLPEARAALADHYKVKLAAAERARRHDEALQCEVLLRAHDRGQHAAFLIAEGTLALVTDPPGARVVIERHVQRERRLTAEVIGDLGTTPIVEMPLEKGSYRLRLTAPGYAEVRVPVLIERGERWDGCPPGSREPLPIALPRSVDLDEDEVYVPAGWAWTGGDRDAPDSLPAARVWVDGFIVGRFPVTNEQYLAFLNDLVVSGREEEALLACPRPNRALTPQAAGELCFLRGRGGLFELDPNDTVDRWTRRGPAALMSWHGAAAYARWLAERTGRPYRLIHELEREKAVRGVDGRLFPWGDFLDPTWACMQGSHEGDLRRADVDAYPEDESPYGMRGGAGNSHDFCMNAWTLAGPCAPGGRVVLDGAKIGGSDLRSVRGGGWSSVENHCRAAARFAMRPDQRHNSIGLRVARSFP